MDVFASMEIGLRVLTAINERQRPAPEDVEALRRLKPELDLPADQLAGEILEEALAILKQKRAQGGSA